MNKWKQVIFEDIYSTPSRNGLTRPKAVRGEGYKMVNMGELFKYPRIGDIDMERVKMNDREIANYSLEQGDLLFARQSLVAEGAGKCAIVNQINEISTFESHLIRVRLDVTKVNPWFYFYYFLSNIGQSKTQSLVNQVAAAGIRGSELARLEVDCPLKDIQDKIAIILSAYDNLIENNNRRIAILEEMAQRLYHEWFVHFRFPGHESVKMVESDLGLIPKGWKTSQVKQIVARVKKGTVYTEKDVGTDGDVPVIDQSTSEVLGYHNNNADLCATLKEPIAIFGDHTCKMQLMVKQFSVGPNVIPFNCNRHHQLSFIYFAIMNLIETKEYKRHWNEFMIKQIILPTEVMEKQFTEAISPMLNQLEILKEKNTNLRKTRDLLLPRLISGDIDVSELPIPTEED